jgi:hypothetical protein
MEMPGKLLQFTRQMDMLMQSEYRVDSVVRNFLAGNYRLDRSFIEDLQGGLRNGEPRREGRQEA